MTHRGPFQPLLFCDSVILWLKNNRCWLLSQQCTGSNVAPVEAPWFPSIIWFMNWRAKGWSARLIHTLTVPYDQSESLMDPGDFTVDYHDLNEVTPPLSGCHAGCARTSNLSQRQPNCMPQLIMCFSQSLWQQSIGHSLLSLEEVSSTPGINCPRVETQPYHLPWADPDCNGTEWSCRTPSIHWWHYHVGQHNRRFFWER